MPRPLPSHSAGLLVCRFFQRNRLGEQNVVLQVHMLVQVLLKLPQTVVEVQERRASPTGGV